jgi:hypothetical protein
MTTCLQETSSGARVGSCAVSTVSVTMTPSDRGDGVDGAGGERSSSRSPSSGSSAVVSPSGSSSLLLRWLSARLCWLPARMAGGGGGAGVAVPDGSRRRTSSPSPWWYSMLAWWCHSSLSAAEVPSTCRVPNVVRVVRKSAMAPARS